MMMVDLKPNMSVIILNKNAVHMSFIKQRQENGFLNKSSILFPRDTRGTP